MDKGSAVEEGRARTRAKIHADQCLETAVKINQHSPLPNFMFMVNTFSVKLRPDCPELSDIAKDFESAFRAFWSSQATRADMTTLNSAYDYRGEGKTLEELQANSGTAFIALTWEEDMVSKHYEVSHATFSRKRENGTLLEIPGYILPIVPFDKQRYPGLRGRDACTENRLLNGLGNAVPHGVALSGSIYLYTDRLPCASCSLVIKNFVASHPDVRVAVIYAYQDTTPGGREAEKSTVMALHALGVDAHHVEQTALPAPSTCSKITCRRVES